MNKCNILPFKNLHSRRMEEEKTNEHIICKKVIKVMTKNRVREWNISSGSMKEILLLQIKWSFTDNFQFYQKSGEKCRQGMFGFQAGEIEHASKNL